MQSPRTVVDSVEQNPALPFGPEECFAGYGVMGVPFSSGYILALRHFAASSDGPGYTSVWIRDPAAPSERRRPVGSRSAGATATPFSVKVGHGVHLSWDLTLAATPVTALMPAVSGSVPERLWRSRTFLRAMGAVADPVLRAGHIALTGRVPNGQSFGVRPRRIWFVRESAARLLGHTLGQAAALPFQDRLGDFWIPSAASS